MPAPITPPTLIVVIAKTMNSVAQNHTRIHLHNVTAQSHFVERSQRPNAQTQQVRPTLPITAPRCIGTQPLEEDLSLHIAPENGVAERF